MINCLECLSVRPGNVCRDSDSQSNRENSILPKPSPTVFGFWFMRPTFICISLKKGELCVWMHNSKRSNLFFSSYLIQQPPAALRVRLSGKFLRKIARKHNILRENPQDRRAEWWILALKWYSLLKAKNRRVDFFGDYWKICTGFTSVFPTLLNIEKKL